MEDVLINLFPSRVKLPALCVCVCIFAHPTILTCLPFSDPLENLSYTKGQCLEMIGVLIYLGLYKGHSCTGPSISAYIGNTCMAKIILRHSPKKVASTNNCCNFLQCTVHIQSAMVIFGRITKFTLQSFKLLKKYNSIQENAKYCKSLKYYSCIFTNFPRRLVSGRQFC